MADYNIDLDRKIATVTPRVNDKTARLHLQKKIKEMTHTRGGWEFWYSEQLSTKDKMVFEIGGVLGLFH